MITKSRVQHRSRLKRHIRLHLVGTGERPRLSVFKSLRHVYAQIIDDATGKTLLSVSDLSKDLREQAGSAKGQVALGKLVGKTAAQKAAEKGITTVVFDRNGYLYHGVVKAVADGAREGGLKL